MKIILEQSDVFTIIDLRSESTLALKDNKLIIPNYLPDFPVNSGPEPDKVICTFRETFKHKIKEAVLGALTTNRNLCFVIDIQGYVSEIRG